LCASRRVSLGGEAMNQPFLSRSSEGLTPWWFTTIFREHAILPAGEVVRVQTEIIGPDQGFTAGIAHERFQYTPPCQTAPSTVVVKIPTASRKTISAYRASQAKDIDPFLQRYGSRVPRQVREMIEALASNYGAVRQRLSQSAVTLMHGDFHLDNLPGSPGSAHLERDRPGSFRRRGCTLRRAKSGRSGQSRLCSTPVFRTGPRTPATPVPVPAASL